MKVHDYIKEHVKSELVASLLNNLAFSATFCLLLVLPVPPFIILVVSESFLLFLFSGVICSALVMTLSKWEKESF